MKYVQKSIIQLYLQKNDTLSDSSIILNKCITEVTLMPEPHRQFCIVTTESELDSSYVTVWGVVFILPSRNKIHDNTRLFLLIVE